MQNQQLGTKPLTNATPQKTKLKHKCLQGRREHMCHKINDTNTSLKLFLKERLFSSVVTFIFASSVFQQRLEGVKHTTHNGFFHLCMQYDMT